MQIPKFEIAPYLEIVKRRKWWILVPFVCVVAAGSLYMYATPKMYRASTLILVEAQRVPESYVEPTVTEDLQSRLHTISQQIHSRSYLERVIREYDLYPTKQAGKEESTFLATLDRMLGKLPFTSQGEAASTGSGRDGPSMYSRVKAMRGNIDVSITSKNNRAFEIAFQWNNPETAAKVANAIASQFIEQNLQVREEMAMGTTDFLSVEVRRLRSELEEKERKLESFKKAYMGKLPEQLESNLNILNQLKDELDNLEKRVDMEKQQAMLLRSQLQDESTMGGGGTGEGEPSSDAAELAALRSRLRQLQSKYTDRHPDVVAAKRQIKKKLQQMEESPEVSGSVESEMDRYLSASERAIKNQLAQIGARIDSYEERIGEVRNAIRIYQARVEETPEVELQLKDLERDYETVKNRYQNLLSKKLDAQMAEELEKRQKGEQFRVIDSAVPPEQPFKPDMRRIALMTVVLGLGLGGGLAYVRESLDPAFYSVQDLEGVLGQKVLISLPWEDKR